MMEGNMGNQWGYNPRYSTRYNALPAYQKEEIAKNPEELVKYEVKSFNNIPQNKDTLAQNEKSLNALEILGSQYRIFFELKRNQVG